MAVRIKKYRKLNEDDAAQQGTAPAPATNGNTAAAPNGQAGQPGQPANTATPQQGNANQPADPNAQQQQGPDYNTAVTNVNKFIGNLYSQIYQSVTQNFEKSCPELVNFSKDQNFALKNELGEMMKTYNEMKNVKINPEDAKTIPDGVEKFSKFLTSLTTLNQKLTEEANKAAQGQNGQPGQQAPAAAAQNANQPAAPAPQGGNVSASYEVPDTFGQLLTERIEMDRHLKNIGQYWRL